MTLNIDVPISEDMLVETIIDENKLLSRRQLEEKAALARKRLIRDPLTFFGLNLFKYAWNLDYLCPDSAGAYIAFEKGKDEIINGTIYLNAKEVSKPDFTFANLSWYLLHELLHVILGHLSRQGDRHPVLWNIATDHEIEKFLKGIYERDIAVKLKYPICCYPTIDEAGIIPDFEKTNTTSEQIYDWLFKKKENGQLKISQISSPNSCQGNCNGNGNGDVEFYEVEMPDGSKRVVAVPKNDPKKENEARADIRSQFNHLKEQGNVGGEFAEMLEEALKVEVPWQEILDAAIKTNVIMKPSGRGWKTLNKNYLHLNYRLPGITMEYENDGVGVLIKVIDTSGSMSSDELRQSLHVTRESVKYFETIKVLQHDSRLTGEDEYDVSNFDDLLYKDFEFKGRGGTSHEEIFKRIQTLYEERPDDISLVIMFTDGCSDVEHLWNKFEWSRENLIPTFFLITSDGREIQPVEGAKFKNIKIKRQTS